MNPGPLTPKARIIPLDHRTQPTDGLLVWLESMHHFQELKLRKLETPLFPELSNTDGLMEQTKKCYAYDS